MSRLSVLLLSTVTCVVFGQEPALKPSDEPGKFPALNGNCVKVCADDNCKSTDTNPIPAGQTWYTKVKWYKQNGCCALWAGQCSLCCPDWPTPQPTPAPQPVAPPKCHSIVLTDYQIVGDWSVDAGSVKTDVGKKDVSNCQGSTSMNQDNLKSTTVTITSQTSYTRDQSWSTTFSENLEISDTVEVEAKEDLAFEKADVKDTGTFKSTTGMSFTENGGSSQTTTKTESTEEAAKTDISFVIPAWSQTTFFWQTEKFSYSANYQMTAACVDENGNTINSKTVTGRLSAQPESDATIYRKDTPCTDNTFCVPNQSVISGISKTGPTKPMMDAICKATNLCDDVKEVDNIPSDCRDNGMLQATYVLSKWYGLCVKSQDADKCKCDVEFQTGTSGVIIKHPVYSNIATLAHGSPGVNCLFDPSTPSPSPAAAIEAEPEDSGAAALGGLWLAVAAVLVAPAVGL